MNHLACDRQIDQMNRGSEVSDDKGDPISISMTKVVRLTSMPSKADNCRYSVLDQKHCTATEWSFERQESDLVVVLMVMSWGTM
jgi:hypothetical protein